MAQAWAIYCDYFPFFTLLQFILPVSVGRKKGAVSVWKVDGEVAAFSLEWKCIIWHTAHRVVKGAEGCKVYV